MNLYDRQELLGIIPFPRAVVIGCGGVGTWVAIQLALEGTTQLHGLDHDTLELTNRNRLPYPMNYIGLPKTEALKRYIAQVRPDCLVETYSRADLPSFILACGPQPISTVVFDCTDNLPSQREIYGWTRSLSGVYIRAGYDGTQIAVCDAPPAWAADETEPDGYQITPSWVVPAVIVAALAVGYAHGICPPYVGDICEITTHRRAIEIYEHEDTLDFAPDIHDPAEGNNENEENVENNYNEPER